MKRKLMHHQIKTFAVITTLSASFLLSSEAFAATPGEMLEKGIYTEETKGDLDAAIQLYEAVIADGKNAEAAAAQALYRLGQCHQKKKNQTAATIAFERLIKEYPGQKDLVELARKQLPAALQVGPIPWEENEFLHFSFKLDSGVKVGAARYFARKVEVEGIPYLTVGCRSFVGRNSSSEVWTELVTFKPVKSRWMHYLFGEAKALYREGEVEVQLNQSEPSITKLDKQVWDNEQVVHLIRRLPLAPGYKATLSVISSLSRGANVPIELEVTRKEKISVPAGEFECFKVELNVNQTFWYSTAPQRHLVRFLAGGVTAELLEIGKRAEQPTAWADAASGLKVTLPAGWWVDKQDQKEGNRAVYAFVDEDGTGLNSIRLQPLDGTQEKGVRAWAEQSLKNEASEHFKNFAVRADSWQERTISGHPAVTSLAEGLMGEKEQLIYTTYMLTPTQKLSMLTIVPADKFEAYRPEIDKLIESIQLP
ncbi:MAG: tetratricopeptide repeat protein [Verrucomicrobiota bacterium]|nr:tetratricopeptide repeat protein [Verrucomicrobiota bacterium]